MKLIIFATQSDQTIGLFEEACERRDVELQVIYFHEMSVVDGVMQYRGKKLEIRDEKIIIRWPWNAHDLREDYNVYVQQLLFFRDNIFLDFECLYNYSPFYEDKLFQSFIFQELDISSPSTYHFSEISQLRDASYPLIAKKRVASRWRNNFVVKNHAELEERLADVFVGDYVFQPFLDIAQDIRILMYKGKVFAMAEKNVTEDSPGVVRVKYSKEVSIEDEQVISDCRRLVGYLGADLVGIDVLRLTDGSYTFLEANLSPQFVALKRSTGKDVAELVVADFVSSEK